MHHSRFAFLAGASALAANAAAAGAAPIKLDEPSKCPVVSAAEAQQRLVYGNERFVTQTMAHPEQTVERRKNTASVGQCPWALVLTCSDSRVPADVVFDRGLGDLFVARTAGNVIDPIVIGSLQYARAHYHTNLLVVLGHEKCGAVEATLAWMQGATPPPPPFILSVTEAIKPAINTGMTVEEAVKANATYVAQRLRIPPDLRKMRVVPAYYTMSTGRVTYLPEPRSAG